MRIYVVQNFDCDHYEMLYVGTDLDIANGYLKLHERFRLIYGSVWLDGEEVESDLREFE